MAIQNKKEDFVSFDSMKKQQEDVADPSLMGGWQLIGDSISEAERTTLDTYITILLNQDQQVKYPYQLLK